MTDVIVTDDNNVIEVDGGVSTVEVQTSPVTVSAGDDVTLTVENHPVTVTATTTAVTVAPVNNPVTILTAATQGPPGPPGPPGPSGTTYVYEQVLPATTWNVTHGLNKKPSVTVVDSGGTVVVGTLVYLDNNHVTLTFNVAFGGAAYFN